MKLKKLLPVIVLSLCSCVGKNTADDKNIIVGASPTPHSLILEQAKPLIEESGYKLTIKVFNDYVTPNYSVDAGDIDANYFQHEPYLNDFNEKNGTDIVSVLKVHFEPMAIYSDKYTEIGWHILKEKESKIAIPNDASNKARAMALLENEFGELLSHYTIVEAEAQSLPALMKDVDYAVINGNYALNSKITDKLIAKEPNESETAQNNANIIAVKRENRDKEFVKVLISALTSEKVKNYINETFGGTVVAL